MEQGELEKIFEMSFLEYGDAIFRFCLLKVSDSARAEDMTQEVFVRYWQSLRAGKEMTNTRSFLYTIAYNMAKDWYKKKKSESLDARIERGHEPFDKNQINAEKQSAYNEILSAMAHLEDIDKEVLLLRYVEGLSPKDIAESLGETANTISVRLNRATVRLQKQLHI